VNNLNPKKKLKPSLFTSLNYERLVFSLDFKRDFLKKNLLSFSLGWCMLYPFNLGGGLKKVLNGILFKKRNFRKRLLE